ncbi:MAG: membrane protein [Saprospiraceae bacterium]|nr:MAG: membrane protein [Saprospiraceae bacterium]
MITQLLRFEWRYHIKHISFLAFGLFFGLMGFLLSGRVFGESNLYDNSTYNITLVMGLLSLAALFCMMVLASRVLLRDHQYKMEELIYATPVLKRSFLASRFIGFFTIATFLFSFSMLGLWLGAMLSPAGPDKLGPILLSHYIWPFMVLAVPNLLLGGVVLFAIASLTRNTMATYLGGIFLYCLYWSAAMFLNSPMMAASTPASPEGLALAAVLDPFGLSAFFEQTQYWEVAQKNSSLIALEGHFLYNRILWVAVSGLVLLGNYFGFRFRRGVVRRSTIGQAIPREPIDNMAEKISLANRSGQTKKPIKIQQLWSNFRIEFRQVTYSWPFLLILLLWAGIVASEILTRIYGGGEYGTSLYPTTNLMIWLYEEPFQFLAALLVIFYAGEVVHRERELVMHELKDSLPAGNMIFYGSKYLALASIPMLLIGTAVVISIGCQLSKGWMVFEPLQYVASFYLLGFPFCLFAVLALFIQTITPNKYVGMFFCLLGHLLLTSSLSHNIGIHHPLLKVGAFPEVTYNNMNGFSFQLLAFNWIAVYWSSFYLLVGYVTYRLWRRGTIAGLGSRMSKLRNNWRHKDTVLVSIFAMLFLAIGSFIYYNTNVLNSYQTKDAVLDQMAAYEKKYKAYADIPELNIVELKTKVDLYPSKRKYRINHDYLLENKTTEAVTELWFTTSNLTRVVRFHISNAQLRNHDTIHQVYWFELDEPLLPGQKIHMEYDITDNHQGFKMSTSVREMEIVKNGTNMMNIYLAPSFGYRYGNEITDKEERKKRGLLPKEEKQEDPLHVGETDEDSETYYKFPFEAVISTDFGQTAIAPGKLMAQWEENGRSFFHYKAAQPINNFYSYLSADYQLKQKDHNGISLELYYAPGHDYNIDKMMEAMEQTLDYCQQAFSPYGLDHLRIAELPGHWPMGGYATSGVIGLVENRSFFTDLSDSTSFDVVTKRVAHEVAHQWFGHQLNPKNDAGASMLVESFAKYIECVIIDQQYGKSQLRALLTDQMDDYFKNRNRTNKLEPPLDQVDDQSFIYYAKGCVVMNALRDLLGESILNDAIQELFLCHAFPNPRGSAADFVQILKNRAPAETHTQIDDWVSKVVVYDNKIESVDYQQLTDGRYEITVGVQAQKSKQKADGVLETVTFENPMTIGFFDRHPDLVNRLGKRNYLRKQTIKNGGNQLTFILDHLPRFIVLDPYLHLPDKNVVDNVWSCK